MLEQKVRFACLGMDAFYGRDSTFLEWLNENSITYCADVPANTYVFTEKPTTEKRPEKIKDATQRVDELAKEITENEAATVVDLREGENGMVRVKVWVKEIWVWPAKRDKPGKCQLIIRRNTDGQP